MPTAGLPGASPPAFFMLLCMISFFCVPAVGLCECGYRSNVGALNGQYTFTDLIESDFLHIRDVALDTDWQRQSFTKTPEAGRGPYGMNFSVANVASNPIPDHFNWTGPGILSGDPGVKLVVRSGTPPDGYVDLAQMDSIRTDLLWGSYRASLKLPAVKGTCSAFFWYFNDSQEIDMEFLSAQYDFEKKTFPVNLVLQTPRSAMQGFSERGPNNYVLTNLAFDPTMAFHEYRIDFVPGKVVFFADGEVLAIMNTTVTASSAGHMVLTHWSNGNPYWTAGPPTEDAIMTVAYVKAYFNSSAPDREKRYASTCIDKSSFCVIPDQSHAPDPGVLVNNQSAAQGLFFTDNPSMVQGQIYFKKSGATKLHSSLLGLLAFMMLPSIFAAVFL